ncbi:hypothetical protein TrRE_jg5651, partial [Triparma retinervis]
GGGGAVPGSVSGEVARSDGSRTSVPEVALVEGACVPKVVDAAVPLRGSRGVTQQPAEAAVAKSAPPSIASEVADPAKAPKHELQLKADKLSAASLECTSITPYLYVCGAKIAADFSALKSSGITHILNASGVNLPNYHSSTGSFTYLKLNLLDHRSQDISWFFLRAVSFIHSCRSSRGVCAVHCTQGVSRSAALAIAYLMVVEGMTYREGFDHVKGRRKVANPNVGFICNLLELER